MTSTTTRAYNNASEISSVTPPSPTPVVSYSYDANGNVTNRGSDTFAWDYENRLTSTTVGGTTTSFTYRGDGLRASQTTGSTTTSYTWDLNSSLPVVLDDGSKYVYGNGLVSQVSGANTYYYLADVLGSTMATTDASGNVVNGYTYDVYGKTTATSGSQPNNIQFAGQQTDTTGPQYLRARYYDPATGNFLSRDPLSAMPGWDGSPFGYAAESPASATDPSGLFCVPLTGACTDHDGVSIGGHEATEGIKSATAAAAAAAADLAVSLTKWTVNKLLHDRLTVLGELQAVVAAAVGLVCGPGIETIVPCLSAVALYASITLAKVAVIDGEYASGEINRAQATCENLTVGPLPSPFDKLAGPACIVVGKLADGINKVKGN